MCLSAAWAFCFQAFPVLILYFCNCYYNHKKAFKTLEFLLGEIIFSFIGRFYLYLRYRDKEKVQQELTRKYEGQYRNAGVVLLVDIFMALAVVAIVSLIAAVLYFLVA